MIKVNETEVNFYEGITVLDALKIADENVDQMVIVLLNGKVVQKDNLNCTTVSDNAKISVLRLTSGG